METEGWDVHEAPDGRAGLEKAEAVRPDLIVLDVQMPGLDGFGVFSALARKPDLAGIKVVMLTGVAEKTGIGFSSKDMGAYLGKEPDAYVEKPIEPTALVRTVKRVMGDG
jgi:CheY-like chemotaxis protein